jgi:hypothetical protein
MSIEASESERGSADPSAEGAGYARDAVIALGVGCVEAAFFLLAFRSPWWGITSALVIHLAVVAVFSFLLKQAVRSGRDVSYAYLSLLATAAAGPLGALGSAIIALTTRPRSTPDRLLAEWYERIAHSVAVEPSVRLSDNVLAGRTADLAMPPPSSFLAVMIDGPIAERQTVLGLIARRFHPDYLPVLKAALKSPEPVIRVQAAAVAAHIRPMLTAHLKAAIENLSRAETDPHLGLSVLDTIGMLAQSGLLDESDRLRAEAIAGRLDEVVLAAIRRSGHLPVERPPNAGDDAKRRQRTLERLLIEHGRFADLRRLRSAQRIRARRRDARVRPICHPRAAAPGHAEARGGL